MRRLTTAGYSINHLVRENRSVIQIKLFVLLIVLSEVIPGRSAMTDSVRRIERVLSLLQNAYVVQDVSIKTTV